MEDSQPDSSPNMMFSLRIVSIDYYMSPPVPPLDISYSTFQGGKVNEVPVIRIFGSTPAGQKTCLHIHRALPYFYVPCGDLFPQLDEQGDAHTHALSQALEKGLKLKGSAGSKRQHIHSCSVVRAKKFYGYHSSEDPFMKIYLYHPQDVSRAANLLLEGAVLGKVLQPHESHIPFILQFMVDYNLYGMGHIHVSKLKFRNPVPQSFSQKITSGKGDQGEQKYKAVRMVENSKVALCNSPIWQSSTIPDSWIWHSSSASDQESSLVNRQSTSELEGDAAVEEILNQQCISYTSLSQTHSEMKMVPSLVPIWEEFERSGMQGVAMVLDLGKPPPSDVLRTLRGGIEFRDMLMESSNDIESLAKSLINTSSEDYTKEPMSSSNANKLRLSSHSSSSQGHFLKHNEDLFGSPKILSDQPSQVSETIKQSDLKASDHDALRLLKWLASSQAAEDINSDDELSRDAILSPILPVATIDKVLERANLDYESESQKECQDILDTVQDGISFEDYCRRSSSSTDPTSSCNSFSTDTIPQVDGSSDETSHKDTPYKINDFKISPNVPCQNDFVNSSTGCKQKMPKWGSLPIASGKRSLDSSVRQSVLDSAFGPESYRGSESDFKDTSETCSLIKRKAANFLDNIQGNTSSSSCLKRGTSGNTECSMRDLMRRKRSYKIDQSEVNTNEFGEGLNDSMRKENGSPSAELINDIKDSLASSTFKFPTADTQIESKTRNISCVPAEHLEVCNMTPSIGSDHCPIGINNSDIRSSTLSDQSHNSGEGYYIVPDRQRSSESLNHEICSSFRSNKKADALLKPHRAADPTFRMCSRNDKGLKHETSLDGMESCSRNDKGAKHKASLDGMKPLNTKFQNQPPTLEWNDTTSSHPSNFLPEEVNIKQFDPLEVPDAILPFYSPGHPMEHEFQFDEVHDHHINRGSIMGVPIHCKKDGSYLYMLTPKYSPPSGETVARELCVDDMNTLKRIIPTEQELPSPKGSFKEDAFLLGSEPQICDTLLQTASVSNLEHVVVDKGSSKMRDMRFLDDAKNISHNEGDNMRCETSVSHSEEISQISGPDSRLKLTPLSQIGFRDPANVSGGQQLTLVSIEILANSRGDLRPDPRFDAINLIILVFQEDNECESDVHILLHCISETTGRSRDGMSDCKVFVFSEEKLLLNHFIKVICSSDPDILLGWDVQRESLGYLAERSAILGFNLLNLISRTPSEISIGSENLKDYEKENLGDMLPEPVTTDTSETAVIEDEWGRTHASGIHVNGRIVLNIWRLMRGEVKLNFYSLEAVAEAVLRRKVPCISYKVLAKWFASGPGCARYQCIDYILGRTKLNLQITSQLDIINRTSELARVFGIDFFSVLSRGSQYRVESMFLRLAHTQNYLAISPGKTQVASQPAMECIPLVMEPESGFYADPVVVLDFQSLYPSMIIAYNLCFCTCLGKAVPSKADILGVSSYSPDKNVLQNLKHEMLFTPNGVMYVPSKERKGVLPRLLEEILSTRIMVKQAMKKLVPSQQVLHRVFDARQLALKLIANVTYGYTAAGFSGRMPCAELADSIVQCARRTLETAISFVNAHQKWQAKVIYGDTDSMFVLLKGRSVKEAFQVGHEIAAAITEMNPYPVALKMEKVYHPCFLLTKKRYVGYSYENMDQSKAKFDAKGIETVRRDTCFAVTKMMEQSLRVFFEQKDIEKVKEYVLRQWKRIISGRVPLQDFVFAKEVRLGTYSLRASSLPPAAIVASKAMRADPRAEPLYAERVPYIVVHGEPGSRLIDMVVDPQELLAIDSPYRLNDMYYIKKQIIPALQRAFGLVGAHLNQWLLDMPRPRHEVVGKSHSSIPSAHRTRIEFYYLSKHCILCHAIVHGSAHICHDCSRNEAIVAMTLTGKTSKLERDIQHLAAICRHCGGGDWRLESGIKCTSLACSVYYERRKVQKELRSLSAVAYETGFYPKCMVEYF